jgi:hypothetical protein
MLGLKHDDDFTTPVALLLKETMPIFASKSQALSPAYPPEMKVERVSYDVMTPSAARAF